MATFAMTHNPTYLAPIFRPEFGTRYQTNKELQTNYLEKRQVFLRSYQFSRKQSFGEKLRRYLVRVKRLILLRVCSARKLRRVVWSGLRHAICSKRRRLCRLVSYYYNINVYKIGKIYKYELVHRFNSKSSRFW
ncbi:hypothetical protein RND81_11G203900 [Saponaria officinalis]|uniref:Ribosomal protein S14 n=1 Tax=Saponaria officinalis TaxID=3572 RepID=A0AAW1HPM3_SAPOF